MRNLRAERLRPTTLTAGDTWLTRLVKTRNIVVVPAANALGWDVHQREEADLDPNRDYPHDQPRECLQSQTAKTINSLFQEFRFRTCVTFHGGIDLIGYPWGDIEHDQRPTSPDDAVFTEAARIMRRKSDTSGAAPPGCPGMPDFCLASSLSLVAAMMRTSLRSAACCFRSAEGMRM